VERGQAQFLCAAVSHPCASQSHQRSGCAMHIAQQPSRSSPSTPECPPASGLYFTSNSSYAPLRFPFPHAIVIAIPPRKPFLPEALAVDMAWLTTGSSRGSKCDRVARSPEWRGQVHCRPARQEVSYPHEKVYECVQCKAVNECFSLCRRRLH
jgi:hypothetical protein